MLTFLDDDLPSLEAPLRPDEERWPEDTKFTLSPVMGFTAPYEAEAGGRVA